jgi:hypothetical protein
LENKEGIALSLHGCKSIRSQLLTFIKSESLAGSDELSSSLSASPVSSSKDIYDHSRCTDCNISYALAADCIDNLTTLEKQTSDASKSLKMLVETRERIRDFIELLDIFGDTEEGDNSSDRGSLSDSARSIFTPRGVTSSIASYFSAVYDDFSSHGNNSTHGRVGAASSQTLHLSSHGLNKKTNSNNPNSVPSSSSEGNKKVSQFLNSVNNSNGKSGSKPVAQSNITKKLSIDQNPTNVNSIQDNSIGNQAFLSNQLNKPTTNEFKVRNQLADDSLNGSKLTLNNLQKIANQHSSDSVNLEDEKFNIIEMNSTVAKDPQNYNRSRNPSIESSASTSSSSSSSSSRKERILSKSHSNLNGELKVPVKQSFDDNVEKVSSTGSDETNRINQQIAKQLGQTFLNPMPAFSTSMGSGEIYNRKTYSVHTPSIDLSEPPELNELSPLTLSKKLLMMNSPKIIMKEEEKIEETEDILKDDRIDEGDQLEEDEYLEEDIEEKTVKKEAFDDF